jgi:long-chain acyl-CoA synthetase
MRESPYIEQIMIIGSGRKFVSALIVPSILQLRKWLQDAGTQPPADNASLVRMPEVEKLIRSQLDKYNVQFNQVEQVKKFTLLPEEWSINNGELTPSLKVKRKIIEQKYAAGIEAMYD